MIKFKNKYRIESARLSWWNYGWQAPYFITVCTGNNRHFFGEIKNGVMCLNAIGTMVYKEWVDTPSIRPDMNLILDEFIVMPNHFHAIIYIGRNRYNSRPPGRDAMHGVSTGGTGMHGASARGNKFGPQRKNLASIMRGFKSAVTMDARKINPNFRWQPRFHDHIIRNRKSYFNIKRYIQNNPAKWSDDRFYSNSC